MTTGTPFAPTSLSTSVVNPEVATIYRRFPYISVSEFLNAPTAVATNALVPGASPLEQTQALADVIMRASAWADEICFHTADGTLAASPSTEAAWIKPKPDGSLALPCKYRPILELDAVAIGSSPSQAASLGTCPDAAFGLKTIYLPNTPISTISGDLPTWPAPSSYASSLWVAWTYVNGFAHTYLADAALAGAQSIVVAPTTPGGSVVYGVYPGTQLTIRDGQYTESVTVQSVSGTTLNLASPLLNAHTPPAAPDAIRVSALPWDIEQAVISLTMCLIKVRGTRAMVLPMTPGSSPSHQELIEAGGLEDYQVAVGLLKPFTTVVTGHN